MVSTKIKVERLKQLVNKLRRKAAKRTYDPNASVIVGYSASYAVYVHENLTNKHPGGGQAKFLEQPFRENKDTLEETIRRNLNKGRTMAHSLLIAGKQLQGLSEPLVPVDTGVLKASAFTRLEDSPF